MFDHKPLSVAIHALSACFLLPLAAETQLGVSINPQDFNRIPAWESWTGQRAGIISDSLFAHTWADLDAFNNQAGTGSALNNWQAFLNDPANNVSPDDYVVEFALPMMPGEEMNNPNRWQEILNGDHDAAFNSIAVKLIETGFHDCQLRLAWEFNVNAPSNGWQIGNDPSTWNTVQNGQIVSYGLFAQVWQHIHQVMMTAQAPGNLPAPAFQWVWCVLIGQDEDGGMNPVEHAYPGDAYVDFVSVDIYDTHGGYYWPPYELPQPGSASMNERTEWLWQFLAEGKDIDYFDGSLASSVIVPCLDSYRAFATARNKGFGISEWGIVEGNRSPFASSPDPNDDPLDYKPTRGGNDNPLFIERMHEWISQNNVDYTCYFEFFLSRGILTDESDSTRASISHALLPNYWNDPNLISNPLHPLSHPHPLSAAKFLELFYSSVSTQVPGAFVDDFDDNLGDGWNLASWTISGGTMQAPFESESTVALVEGMTFSAPLVARVEVKFSNAWKSSGLTVLHDGTQGYHYTVTTDGQGNLPLVRLWRGNQEIVNEFTSGLDPNLDVAQQFEEISLTVTPEGSGLRFHAYIGTVLVIDHLESSPLAAAGQAGVVCLAYEDGTEVDNFAVVPTVQSGNTGSQGGSNGNSGYVIFENDFDDWDSNGWTVDANGWFATRKGFRCLAPSSSKRATAGDYPDWNSYRVELKLCISKDWQPATLHAYLDDNGNGYSLEFRGNNDGNLSHVVLKEGSGELETAYLSDPFPIASFYQDIAFEIKDVAGGLQLRCEVNGQPLIDYLDPTPSSDGGKIALECAAWTVVSVDDVRVVDANN